MDELRYQIMEVAKQIHWMPAFGLDRELARREPDVGIGGPSGLFDGRVLLRRVSGLPPFDFATVRAV